MASQSSVELSKCVLPFLDPLHMDWSQLSCCIIERNCHDTIVRESICNNLSGRELLSFISSLLGEGIQLPPSLWSQVAESALSNDMSQELTTAFCDNTLLWLELEIHLFQTLKYHLRCITWSWNDSLKMIPVINIDCCKGDEVSHNSIYHTLKYRRHFFQPRRHSGILPFVPTCDESCLWN